MSGPPDGRCGYTWPEGFTEGNTLIVNQQHCCYRETYRESDKCIWHSDFQKVDEKPIEELKSSRVSQEIQELNSPYSELLCGAILQDLELENKISFENVNLRDSDFGGANLGGANLTGTHLFNANMNDTNLIGADLRGAHLESTDVQDASFWRANLSGARLDVMDLEDVSFRNANLTNASFQEANFNGVRLYGADLSGANMRYVEVNQVEIDHQTTLGRQERAEASADSATDWDLIAQAHHEFKSVFSDHGFVGKARNQHFWERRARALQAKESSNRLNGWAEPTYVGSLISRVFTGYGVRVSHLVGWMAALFLLSTIWYIHAGVETTALNNLTYSIVAFTAAPPNIPSGSITQLVVMAETFFGTLLIVLMGYILGNREQF